MVNPINIIDDSIVPDTSKLINDETIKRLSNYVLDEGDVVVGRRGEIGRCAVVGPNEKGWVCGTGSFFVRPSPSLDSRFLAHLIRSPDYREQLVNLSTGTTMKNLSNTALGNLVIPVPPPAEQHRIVAILDEAFDGIATAKASAEHNLQNARALFESHLQAVFTERGEGWVVKQLREISEVQSGGTPSISKKEFWNGSIPWYSSGELNQTFTSAPERRIAESGLNNSNAKLFPKGSLLVGMYDTAALKMSILDRDASFNQAIAGIKPNENIEVEFILYAINANKQKLLLERRGTRQKNLSLGKIKEIAIPLPPVAEQRSTIVQLRRVMSETQRLESLYRKKLAALDELKKSLLHRAFSGGL